jgi:hypothetical protein
MIEGKDLFLKPLRGRSANNDRTLISLCSSSSSSVVSEVSEEFKLPFPRSSSESRHNQTLATTALRVWWVRTYVGGGGGGLCLTGTCGSRLFWKQSYSEYTCSKQRLKQAACGTTKYWEETHAILETNCMDY